MSLGEEVEVSGGDVMSETSTERPTPSVSTTDMPRSTTDAPGSPIRYYPPGRDYKYKVIKQTFTKDSLKTYSKYQTRNKRDLPGPLDGQEPRADSTEEDSNKIPDVFERYEDADFLFNSDYSRLSDSELAAPFGWDTREQKYKPKPTVVKNGGLLPLLWPSAKPEVSQPEEESDSCGVRKFQLDFADIGWEDRVVAPKAVPFNYCGGACNSVPNLVSYIKKLNKL